MRNLVFHLCLLMEKGLELCSALQLSKRVQAQGEATPKQKSPLLYPPFSFLWERKGVLLTVCLQLRAKRSRASPSFASCYALATAEGRPSPKPSPTPLHVISCCAMRRLNLALSRRKIKFAFSGCGSR